MKKALIKQLIESRVREDGLFETGVKSVKLFRVSNPVRCAPAIYEPAVIAIVSGAKEAIVDGQKYEYDHSQYMCCTMSIPVEAGTPRASPENPLLGVYVSLETKVMTELVISMENAIGVIRKPQTTSLPHGLSLAPWDEVFTDALYRLVKLGDSHEENTLLGDGRLREFYYAVLKGDAGSSARRAFGVGNEIARSIAYLSTHLDKAITIDDMAAQVGMSRAVLHRKFKQATSMSPIQFIKSMRLNAAAMNIAEGMSVNAAAAKVGYLSSSQFSREFKRMYGQSPKQWRHAKPPSYDGSTTR